MLLSFFRIFRRTGLAGCLFLLAPVVNSPLEAETEAPASAPESKAPAQPAAAPPSVAPLQALQPAWPSYADVPAQDKMALELKGPDGRMYPNFTWAGLPDDVQRPTKVFELNDFSERGDLRGKYIDEELKKALAEANKAGGGIIQFSSGTFFLAKPVLINHSNIVLRGMGRGSRWKTTTLEFHYQPEKGKVDIVYPEEGGKLHPEGYILITGDPGIYADLWTEGPNHQMRSKDRSRQLKRLAIYLNGELLVQDDKEKNNHAAPQCYLIPYIHHFWRMKPEPGPATIKAVAEWKDGSKDEKTINVTIDPNLPNDARAYGSYAMISFTAPWRPPAERFVETQVAKDIKRGDTSVTMLKPDGFAVGDYVRLSAKKPKLKAEDRNRYATEFFRIIAIDGNRFQLSQPVRLPCPLQSEPKLRRMEPLRNCGIEHMTLVQKKDTWMHGLYFQNAWGCWVDEVEIVDCGRNPTVFPGAKFCVQRNSLFNGGRYPNSGGSSNYAGWSDTAQDCLMDNVTTVRLRHAPNFQGQTNGSVIRNSTFENSDLQYHAFHPYENLIENCKVIASPGSGSYGYAMYVVKPGGQHGIAGPRNVVWGNELIATHKAGVLMGGMTEGWQVVYNRVKARAIYDALFAAVVLRDKTSTTTFLGNDFTIEDGNYAVKTEGDPGEGNAFIRNAFHGVSKDKFYQGDWTLEAENNIFTADGERAAPWSMPPSLYLWQLASVGKGLDTPVPPPVAKVDPPAEEE